MSTTDSPEGVESTIPETPLLQLETQVDSPHACLRHVVVTIPRDEVRRYLKQEYDQLVPEAQVPGFRPGRAPRQLVEKQFKERVFERVKGSLLMDSLTQVTESAGFSAIGEPDFDFDSIELPDDGDFRYEFSVEVRPEFDTPVITGLSLNRSVEVVSDEDVMNSLNSLLQRYGRSEATEQPAAVGDELSINAVFSRNGQELSRLEEGTVFLRPALSFHDARMEGFGELMTGAVEGERRRGTLQLSAGHEDQELAGAEVDVEFEVIEVRKYHAPKLTTSFLDDLGGFESAEELRGFVRGSLQRQADYRQQQQLREQITSKLLESTSFDLPVDLVRRQTKRELERKVLELRRSGFSDDQIGLYSNTIRQNAQAIVESSIREHFILEKIAEENEIDADESEYEQEVALIAQQRGESARRVRARLEKQGQMDALRNQIVERKVIEMIVSQATITDVEASGSTSGELEQEHAVEFDVIPVVDEASAIPAAKYDDHGPATDDKS